MAQTENQALTNVKAPAIGLIATGSLFFLVALWALFFLWDRPLPSTSGTEDIAAVLKALMKLMTVVAIAAAAAQVYGAVQMLNLKSLGWAKAAAIIAICSVLSSGILGLLLGLPIGIWALVVLRKESVNSAFV